MGSSILEEVNNDNSQAHTQFLLETIQIQQSNHLSEKVKSITERDFSSYDFIGSLDVIVSVYDKDNSDVLATVLSGRQKNISQRSLLRRSPIPGIHEAYYQNLRTVSNALQKLQSDVGTVVKQVEHALNELENCRTTNEQVLEKAQTLQHARNQVKLKRTIATSLVNKLKISDKSFKHLIHQCAVPGNSPLLQTEFFSALDEITAIKNSANQLELLVDRFIYHPLNDISKEKNKEIVDMITVTDVSLSLSKVASKDSLEETKELMNLAYEKLFFFCQTVFKFVEDPADLLMGHYEDDFIHKDTPIQTLKEAINEANIISNHVAPDISEGMLPQQINSIFAKKAIHLLQEQPRYFLLILFELAKKRRHLLLKQFHIALNRCTNPNFSAQTAPLSHYQPIDTTIIDTPRYISDMFEYIQTAAIKEQEFAITLLQPFLNIIFDKKNCQNLQLLLNDSNKISTTTFQIYHSSVYNVDDDCLEHFFDKDASHLNNVPIFRSCDDMLDFIFTGLVPAFKHRLDQTLANISDSPSDLCRVYQIIGSSITLLRPILCNPQNNSTLIISDAFKADTGEILSVEHLPTFLTICTNLKKEIYHLFLASLENKTVCLSELPISELWVSDLSIPQFLDSNVKCLIRILHLCEESLKGSQTDQPDIHEMIDDSINAVITPLLNFCRNTAPYLPQDSSSVYLLNCYSYVHNSLASIPSTGPYLKLCTELITEQMNELVDTQSDITLEKLGFIERLNLLRQWQKRPDELKERQPLSTISALHPLSLSACLRSFYNVLFSMGALALPLVDRIASRILRTEARKRILTNIANAYEELFNGTLSSGVATHTPEQIKQLLDI